MEAQVYNDKLLNFYAPTELVEQFNAKCKKHQINKSEWFRAQIKKFLEE